MNKGLKKETVRAASQAELPSFKGNFTHVLDEKGRVSLPAEFREALEMRAETSVVLTNYISDGSRCLEGFGHSAWMSFEQKLRSRSRFDAKLQKLENFYLSRAAQCPLDKNGRILVPQHLRAYAALEREVTFTSSIHGFRVWNKKIWDLVFAQAEEALMADPSVFAELDI